MLRHFSYILLKFTALCSHVIFKKAFSKAPYGFYNWTFINVQNGKPKVEFTFSLLLEKFHTKPI